MKRVYRCVARAARSPPSWVALPRGDYREKGAALMVHTWIVLGHHLIVLLRALIVL